MVQFNHCPPGREKTTSATVLPQVDILQESVKISLVIAEVAELADALRSGRSELTLMWVQVPPSAPHHQQRLIQRNPLRKEVGFVVKPLILLTS